ncbi:hypothetical protein A2U01_0062335, partial [Trifolium medium]|nr:hypothetical protein [Trifolium medium]
MEAKVEALEGEISEVRSTLVEVQNTVKENHASLIAMLEKCFGKSLVVEEGSASVVVKATSASGVSSEKKIGGSSGVLSEKKIGASSGVLHGDTLTEFRHSVKKV